eukprot:PhM_4_TR15503/c0_g4_i1/m.95817
MLRRTYFALAGARKGGKSYGEVHMGSTLQSGVPHVQFGDQPSCPICFARFRTEADLAVHKTMATHTSRTRWGEMESWYSSEGRSLLNRIDDADWKSYVTAVQSKQEALGLSVSSEKELGRRGRRSRMCFSKEAHPGIDYPAVKTDNGASGQVMEPRDNHWPAEPKPRGG